MLGKKAMLGDQINWVYVLIAGSLIMIFFISIIYKEKQLSDEKIAIESIKAIDSLLSQPARSSQIVKFPGLNLQASCDYGITSLRIGTSSDIKPYEPVFSSSNVKSNEMITMTEEWLVPYKVTNFVFLTGNDSRFVIMYDGAEWKPFAELLYNSLPEQSNKKVYSVTDIIPDQNNRRVVLIGVGTEPKVPGWLSPGAKQLLLKVLPDNSKDNFGQLVYCSRSGSSVACGETEDYFGMPMLLGALYTDNKKEFDCRMIKATERLTIVSSVYYNRADSLSRKATSSCSGKYNLEELQKLAEPDQISIQEIYDASKALETQNTRELLASCPTIY